MDRAEQDDRYCIIIILTDNTTDIVIDIFSLYVLSLSGTTAKRLDAQCAERGDEGN